MKNIIKKIAITDYPYLIHDTKADIRTLSEYCNMLADKINELNKEINELKENLKGKEND